MTAAPAIFADRIERVAIETLKANPRNARTHSKRQIKLIAESLKAFGFVNPVLIDENGMIIAGHGRVEAAKRLGMTARPRRSASTISPTTRSEPTSWPTISSPRGRAGTTRFLRSNCSI